MTVRHHLHYCVECLRRGPIEFYRYRDWLHATVLLPLQVSFGLGVNTTWHPWPSRDYRQKQQQQLLLL